jgi:hypothetical protein
MASRHAEPFHCPTCQGQYKLVRAEADGQSFNGTIECYYCDGPSIGREGQFVLKYFVADQPKKQARRRERSRPPQLAASELPGLASSGAGYDFSEWLFLLQPDS